mmetsp:Transcript_82904/g.234891  ORF Transcript_82904/g.234891 Transcript_82904/m.234891 type:complete len:217 (-) Transcript_82904:1068-1718(-)
MLPVAPATSGPCSPFTLPGRVLDDVVDPDDHLRGLAGGAELRHLAPEGLHDAQSRHVRDGAVVEVQACRVLAPGVGGPELPQELGGVVAAVVGQDRGDLLQGLREGLHGPALLALDGGHALQHGVGHGHLRGASTGHDAGLRHGLVQHREGVVQRPLRLVQDVRRGTAQDDGAGFALRAARKLDDLVFPDHDLLDLLAEAKLRLLRAVECRSNVRT